MVRQGRSRDFPMPRMAAARGSAWAFAFVLLLLGCKSSSKTALIEAELRTREREIRTMRSELERATLLNTALQNELAQRIDVCPSTISGGVIVDGPQSVLAGTVTKVLLGRGTGGIDDDGIPGDEALQVVIVPIDTDGSALKVPGKALVQAYEITREGLKLPLCQWEVSPLELQRTWRSGLFTTGYFVTLPWRVLPSNDRLRVVVQFQTLPNHRVFEVDRDLTIKPMGGRLPRSMPTNQPVPQPAPRPTPSPDLPAPMAPPVTDGPILGPVSRHDVNDFSGRIDSAKTSFGVAPSRVRLLSPILTDERASDR